MYKDKQLKSLQVVQKNVFEAIQQFISYYNTKIDPGEYLAFEEKNEESVTVKVGVERFTVHRQIKLSDNKVSFQVYAWIFDLSKPGRYRHEVIPDMEFYCDDLRTVCFVKSKFYEKRRSQYEQITAFNEPAYFEEFDKLFDELEKYTDERLNPKPLKAY